MRTLTHSSLKSKAGKAGLGGAFTMMEVMVAIALFGLVMVSIYSSWMSIVRGTKIGLEAANSAQRARIALHTVEDALLTAQFYNENNRYYNVTVDSSNEKFGAIQFTSRLPETFLGSGYFGDEVVRQVTFYVEKGDGNENNLVMTQVPLLDANEQKDPYKIVLARDVTHFELEFFNPPPFGKDREFGHDYPYTNQIPKLVRVTLGIGHMPGNSSLPNEVVMRLINIPSEMAVSHVQ